MRVLISAHKLQCKEHSLPVTEELMHACDQLRLETDVSQAWPCADGSTRPLDMTRHVFYTEGTSLTPWVASQGSVCPKNGLSSDLQGMVCLVSACVSRCVQAGRGLGVGRPGINVCGFLEQ